jgi:two-component system, LuxR family, sensor kinase FixL
VALIGELAATMSHELRQPLSAIRANAEAGALLLTRSPDDMTTLKQIFRDIVDDDMRAAEVIDQVRALLRKDEPPMSHLDVNPICLHAARLLQGDAKLRHTRLDLSLESGLPLVFGDAVQLQQVVLNLTINALDAASASPDENRSVTIATQGSNGMVEIAIRDTGVGLAPDVKQHLFESFFSTKTRGLGLGLVIVRSIVDRHNGRIFADNHPLGGAVFRVVLPASAAPLASARASIALLDCNGEVQPLL